MKIETRPRCVHCNKAYGSRTTDSVRHEWPVEEPEPAFQPPPGRVTSSKHRATFPFFRDGKAYRVRWYSTWDGISFYEPYRPFCTMRCALHYARRAWERWGIPNP